MLNADREDRIRRSFGPLRRQIKATLFRYGFFLMANSFYRALLIAEDFDRVVIINTVRGWEEKGYDHCPVGLCG